MKDRLATPTCEFAIIAGGKGDNQGWKTTLPGDDDGTVSVATTRLAGARDFIVVPRGHTFIMNAPEVKEYTVRFIEKGHFISAEKRRPIVKEPATKTR